MSFHCEDTQDHIRTLAGATLVDSFYRTGFILMFEGLETNQVQGKDKTVLTKVILQKFECVCVCVCYRWPKCAAERAD